MAGDDIPPGKIRLLLADSSRLERSSVRLGLQHAVDIQVVGEADNGLSAVTAARDLMPDVVAIRPDLPLYNGLQAAMRIMRNLPECGVIIIDNKSDPQTMTEAIRCGASGYLTHENGLEDLIVATRFTHSGISFLPRDLLAHVMDSLAEAPSKPDGEQVKEDIWAQKGHILEMLAELGSDGDWGNGTSPA